MNLVQASTYIKEGKFVEGIKKIDLMGGKVSQLDDFVNIYLIAEKGIRGSSADLSKYIKPSSIDEIVCTSPQADFLGECSKIMKPNSKIYINGTLKNKYFKNITAGKVEQYGFEVVEEQVVLKSRFQNLKFYLSDGITEINKDLIKTTILIKK